MYLLFLLLLPLYAWSWDFTHHNIPLKDIMDGGPPKDGIPALTSPGYVKAGEADFMKEDEQVLEVYLKGLARAYPTRILSWHELVNDDFRELTVLVSW